MRHEDIKTFKESLRNCLALLENIESNVEEGQYWQWDEGGIVRIQTIDNVTAYYKSIHEDGEDPDWFLGKGYLIDNATPLSDDEVEQALIEEAERRGYKKGTKVKISQTSVVSAINRDINYRKIDDSLVAYKGGYTIYKKGDWAKIIEDEWKVIQNPNDSCDYAVESEEKIIRNLSEHQAEAIADALNNMED